jgi:hypothetical protein
VAGPVFAPEQINVMHAAYETVCRKLRIRPGGPAADQVAVMIVDIAATGVLDLNAITAMVLLAADEIAELEKPQSEILFLEQLAKFARVLP